MEGGGEKDRTCSLSSRLIWVPPPPPPFLFSSGGFFSSFSGRFFPPSTAAASTAPNISRRSWVKGRASSSTTAGETGDDHSAGETGDTPVGQGAGWRLAEPSGIWCRETAWLCCVRGGRRPKRLRGRCPPGPPNLDGPSV